MPSNIFIDANIFLRFLVFDEKNPHLSKKSQNIFQKIVDKKITVQTNALIIAEIVYVLEKVYKFTKPEITQKIIPLLSLDHIHILDKEKVIQSLLIYQEKNVDFEDAYSYVDMLEKNIDKIFTFDHKHFSRFEGISIVE